MSLCEHGDNDPLSCAPLAGILPHDFTAWPKHICPRTRIASILTWLDFSMWAMGQSKINVNLPLAMRSVPFDDGIRVWIPTQEIFESYGVFPVGVPIWFEIDKWQDEPFLRSGESSLAASDPLPFPLWEVEGQPACLGTCLVIRQRVDSKEPSDMDRSRKPHSLFDLGAIKAGLHVTTLCLALSRTDELTPKLLQLPLTYSRTSGSSSVFSGKAWHRAADAAKVHAKFWGSGCQSDPVEFDNSGRPEGIDEKVKLSVWAKQCVDGDPEMPLDEVYRLEWDSGRWSRKEVYDRVYRAITRAAEKADKPSPIPKPWNPS